jgi:hypothetical protein
MQGSRKKLAVALVALALVGSACVRRGDPGIGLQDVQTDVEFAAARGAPANARPSATPATAEPPDPSEFDFGKDFLDRLPPTTAKQTSCPEAPVSAAPAQEASLGAKGTPKVGVYRWNRSGEQKITTPIAITIPLGGSEKRLIRNVQQLGGDDFTYEMAQSEVGTDEIVVTTFKVRPNAPNEPLPTTDQRVGAVDRGLSIMKIERFNSKSGQLVSAFEPVTPVLLLPLPVLPGEQVQSAGVDPTSFNVLQINAQVTKRVRVDACGEVVDGWSVEGTRSFSQGSTAGTPHEYDFVVATQLGAMMISEHIKATTAQASIDATFSLGQLEPDPLPKAEKTTG